MAYYYFGGTDQAPPDTVLLMSKYQNRRGRRIILHVNGAGSVGVPPPEGIAAAGAVNPFQEGLAESTREGCHRQG